MNIVEHYCEQCEKLVKHIHSPEEKIMPDYTRINKAFTVKLLVIEVIANDYEYDDDTIQSAIDTLRQIGYANVVEETMLQDTYEQAVAIIDNRNTGKY